MDTHDTILTEQARAFFREQGAKGGKIGGAKNKAKGKEYFQKIAKLSRKKKAKKLSTVDTDTPIV
jgi:hypothetical protein